MIFLYQLKTLLFNLILNNRIGKKILTQLFFAKKNISISMQIRNQVICSVIILILEFK